VLLAALVETDDFKTAATARQRRLKLQTGYGQAMMWSKDYASEETVAWARAWLEHGDISVSRLETALSVLFEQGNKTWLPFFQGLVAD
jgi:hypothetical protein